MTAMPNPPAASSHDASSPAVSPSSASSPAANPPSAKARRVLQSAFDTRVHALAELLPWLSLMGDRLVICKDGSLLACFELRGLDADTLDLEDASRAAARVEQALRTLDGRHTLWSIFQRRRLAEYVPGEFANPLSARIDALHGERFRRGAFFVNRHVLAVLFTPTSTDHLWRACATLLREGRPQAIPALLWQQAQRASRFARVHQGLLRQAREFETQLDAVITTLAGFTLQRLTGEALLGFLDHCAAPASGGQAVRVPGPALLLDAALGQDQLVVGADRLQFTGTQGTRWMAALGIKAWPHSTLPGMVGDLLHLPAELCIAQVFRVVAADEAKAHIQSVQRFHLNLQRSAFSFLREALFGEPGTVQDSTRAVAAEEARLALAELGQHRQVYGYYNLSVLVMAQQAADLEGLVREAASCVRAAGFLVLREQMHLLSAWTGALPGQWGQLVRWHFIHTGNLADLLPLASASDGEAHNAHLSEQLGRPCAALAILPGVDRTRYHFNLHHGDLGHAFVVGPSRSGKSVLVNFLLAQFLRYPRPRILIFDKDRSCRIATLLQGGSHLDPARPADLRCNPLRGITDTDTRRWVLGWLQQLLCLHGLAWRAEHDRALVAACDGLLLLPPDQHRLAVLQVLLPPELATQLDPWVGDGRHAHLFDHADDTFAWEGLTCIELGELLRDAAVSRLFMLYAFRRVEEQLSQATPSPTLIYIEEAWFMLEHPVFREQIRDWLKTLPKRLASVVLATQSLDDLAASPVFSAIADNIPTRIFLANRNAGAQLALYRDQFGLNAAQVTRVARAEPKRQFLLTTPQTSRFIDLTLPPTLLAMLRSDRLAQDCLDRCRASGAADWREAYLDQMAALTAGEPGLGNAAQEEH